MREGGAVSSNPSARTRTSSRTHKAYAVCRMPYALCLIDVGSFFETVRENEDKLKNLQMPVFAHDPSDGPTGTQFTCFTGTNAQLLTQLAHDSTQFTCFTGTNAQLPTQLAHDTHLLPQRQLRPESLMPYALCLMRLADRHVVPRRQLRPPQAARDVQGHSETS